MFYCNFTIIVSTDFCVLCFNAKGRKIPNAFETEPNPNPNPN